MRISDDVLDVLSKGLVVNAPTQVQITAQLDRRLYTKVNTVLEACGGKWSRKHKAHVFESDPSVLIEAVLATGEVTTAQDRGFFATPPGLAQYLVQMAVSPSDIVLEPSAGEGALIEACLGQRVRHVVAVEYDEQRRKKLAANIRAIHDWSWVSLADERDFMDYAPDEPFDAVVMNPPFLRVGKGDHLDHVRHAFDLLAPGGRLASVLPSSVTFRDDKRYREFRAWVDKHGGEIEPLPDRSFKASGTGVNTVTLRMER